MCCLYEWVSFFSMLWDLLFGWMRVVVIGVTVPKIQQTGIQRAGQEDGNLYSISGPTLEATQIGLTPHNQFPMWRRKHELGCMRARAYLWNETR